jgi:hypothetical protein
MQKIENKVDKLLNHLAALENRLQPANISKSDTQSLPMKSSEISSMKRKSRGPRAIAGQALQFLELKNPGKCREKTKENNPKGVLTSNGSSKGGLGSW